MSERNHLQCISCGLIGHGVEAGGIWYCPNPLCRVSGAAWFRCKLKSRRENPDGTHTVDADEWVRAAYEVQIDDPAISEARDRVSDKHFGGYRREIIPWPGVEFP